MTMKLAVFVVTVTAAISVALFSTMTNLKEEEEDTQEDSLEELFSSTLSLVAQLNNDDAKSNGEGIIPETKNFGSGQSMKLGYYQSPQALQPSPEALKHNSNKEKFGKLEMNAIELLERAFKFREKLEKKDGWRWL